MQSQILCISYTLHILSLNAVACRFKVSSTVTVVGMQTVTNFYHTPFVSRKMLYTSYRYFIRICVGCYTLNVPTSSMDDLISKVV